MHICADISMCLAGAMSGSGRQRQTQSADEADGNVVRC